MKSLTVVGLQSPMRLVDIEHQIRLTVFLMQKHITKKMKLRVKLKHIRRGVKAAEAAAKRLGLPDFTAFHGRREIRKLRHFRRRTRKTRRWTTK